jgi:hypothetical protein
MANITAPDPFVYFGPVSCTTTAALEGKQIMRRKATAVLAACITVALVSFAEITQTTGTAAEADLTNMLSPFLMDGAQKSGHWVDSATGEPVTDPETIRQLNEQVMQMDLPADVPFSLRASLLSCKSDIFRAQPYDPRDFLRCQDALRDYDAYICKTHVRAETGPAYDRCRADMAQQRELNKLRATQSSEIRCRREVDGSVLCSQ